MGIDETYRTTIIKYRVVMKQSSNYLSSICNLKETPDICLCQTINI